MCNTWWTRWTVPHLSLAQPWKLLSCQVSRHFILRQMDLIFPNRFLISCNTLHPSSASWWLSAQQALSMEREMFLHLLLWQLPPAKTTHSSVLPEFHLNECTSTSCFLGSNRKGMSMFFLNYVSSAVHYEGTHSWLQKKGGLWKAPKSCTWATPSPFQNELLRSCVLLDTWVSLRTDRSVLFLEGGFLAKQGMEILSAWSEEKKLERGFDYLELAGIAHKTGRSVFSWGLPALPCELTVEKCGRW